MSPNPPVNRIASAKIPIEAGLFQLTAYQNGVDGKDHLAFTLGDVSGQEDVLVRIHSECLTGDVLGSRRCDCGPQLDEALRIIGLAGRGVVLYLRQEGRGIGLVEKLRAYNLQDQGYDTLDANLALGHPADAREYSTAAHMLRDLGIRSVTLLTNNPKKIDGLRQLGIPVSRRHPIQVRSYPENAGYLTTKVRRMEHQLDLERVNLEAAAGSAVGDELESWLRDRPIPEDRPLITLAYAQSLDGSIALEPNKPLLLSGPESQLLTHRLRRSHQGILVGVGTVVADDPQLTVRLVNGESPQPIIVDPQLRFPLHARLLDNQLKPVIAAVAGDSQSAQRTALLARGAEVLEVPADESGLDLSALLLSLRQRGIERLMVEGGARVLRAFMKAKLGDVAVVTIAPRWVGGLSATGDARQENLAYPQLAEPTWRTVGQDSVLWSSLNWPQN